MSDVHPNCHPDPRHSLLRAAPKFEDPLNAVVRFVVPSLPHPVGWGMDCSFGKDYTGEVGGSSFHWRAVHIKSLRLSQSAHLMLVSGASPTWLFLGAQMQQVQKEDVTSGPFVLLSATYPPLHTAPFLMTDVVFGLPTLQKGLTLAQIQPIMVSALHKKD